MNTDRRRVHSYRQTNFLASLYPATHLPHYALTVRIRQQPDDDRHAGRAAADGPAGAAALLIHYPLEDAMRNLTTIFIAALMLFAVPAAAQKPGQTATQFYNEYRTVWVHSKSMDALLPYISKESRAQYDTTPKEQRQPMFKMMKELGTMTSVKVIKETKTPDGYTLELTAIGPKKKPATGAAEIVIEGGAMKLKKESWNM